jgi:CRISPR/Cas system CSM-associated protein Csm3 (group 7 of RAMP superfamily)
LLGFDKIVELLKGGGEARSIEELKKAVSLSTQAAPRLEIVITWKPRLPLMVKAGYDGIGVDMLPLTSGVDKDHLALCLPGSSIKGAMRSHAERIMRTVLPDCDCTKDKSNFHEQIDSIPLIEEVFGARNKSEKEGNTSQPNKKCKSNAKANLGLGALAIDDCYAQGPDKENGKKESHWMNAEAWRRVEIAGDDKSKDETKKNQQGQQQDKEKSEQGEVSYYQRELWKRLREIDLAMGTKPSDEQYKEPTQRFRLNHHVAIDRWTGGASEGALYSVLVPTKVEWEKMRLTMDFGRIEPESQLPALMLLLLTLRDVAENRLPFGFATNRGMGEIEVKSFEFIGSGTIKAKKVVEQNEELVEQDEELEMKLKDALAAVVEDGKCKFADGALKEQTQMRWKKWLQ